MHQTHHHGDVEQVMKGGQVAVLRLPAWVKQRQHNAHAVNHRPNHKRHKAKCTTPELDCLNIKNMVSKDTKMAKRAALTIIGRRLIALSKSVVDRAACMGS